MHIERRMTAIEDPCFETLDALLEGPFAICRIITDDEGRPTDYRFLRVSRGFEEATGFRGVEGRTVLEIVPEVEPKWIELYGRVAIGRLPTRFREGSAATGRDYEVRAAPLDPPGHFVMSFRDVTEPPGPEADLSRELERAQHLLKELAHRVMNSFAAISAILAMEARAVPREGRAGLERVQSRVQALAALYRRLDGPPEVDRVEMGDYLSGLVASFRDSVGAASGASIATDIAPVTLPMRMAVPLALVANELLTDAVAGGFGAERPGRLRVTLAREGDLCRLSVADDGACRTEGEVSKVGRSLVAAFVGELGGEIAEDSGPDGTAVTVTFPA